MLMLAVSVLAASDHRGQVRFGEVPVQGASVQATQGDKTVRALTDPEGRYVLPDLSDGTWTIQIEMPGFDTLRRDVIVAPEAAAAEWNLTMLQLESIQGGAAAGFPVPAISFGGSESPGGSNRTRPTGEPPDDQSAEAADRLLINGSVINGAATPFALQRAFGTARAPRSPYRGTASIAFNSSLFDAQPYSLTGHDMLDPAYARGQAVVTIGGPLQIPKLFRNGSFIASYTRTQNNTANVMTARVPTAAERTGDFSASATQPIDPVSGAPFANGVIPPDRISPEASALLTLYPPSNFETGGPYNYEISRIGTSYGDTFQGSVTNIRLGRRDQLSGSITVQRGRSESPNLFGFVDPTTTATTSASVVWAHRFTTRISSNVRYEMNRAKSESVPHYAQRVDVSGEAGVTGTDRDPRNWGPPALSFASGIARLGDGAYALERTHADSLSYTSTIIVGRHALGYGADYRWQRYDLFSQRDPRGAFTFTGAETGNDFADFLLGVPTASAIAFGNPDKYFRQSFANLYVTDDFRVTSSITLTLGVRWEYETPITERYGRLVNLDVAPDFTSAVPTVAGSADESLVRPDKGGIQPRLAVAWRPRLTSSIVVRAGYGVYRETSVYRTIADQMAQQSPLSKSLNVQNTPEHPLTLANGFAGSPEVTATTFAIDPAFRVGTAHNWQASVQRDLPAAMQATVTYLGITGAHVPRRFLPNTFPAGGENPCPACPVGFVYLTSTGSSNRHGATIELRRRQRNGFEASARYTIARAIDDAGLGSAQIAQNWLDLSSERGPSSFDRRHELVAQGQYTTGMLGGLGSFWDSWRGTLLKEWTISGNLTLGSGTPLTAVYPVPAGGTGMTGHLRPNATGTPNGSDVDGRHVDPAAFAAPAPGEWGNAGRNSVTGPAVFQLNASLARSIRLNQRVSMDFRIDVTNLLNTVTYPDWNTTLGNAQFGLPTRANEMRTIRPSMRWRF
jgi:hypothetical protein